MKANKTMMMVLAALAAAAGMNADAATFNVKSGETWYVTSWHSGYQSAVSAESGSTYNVAAGGTIQNNAPRTGVPFKYNINLADGATYIENHNAPYEGRAVLTLADDASADFVLAAAAQEDGSALFSSSITGGDNGTGTLRFSSTSADVTSYTFSGTVKNIGMALSGSVPAISFAADTSLTQLQLGNSNTRVTFAETATVGGASGTGTLAVAADKTLTLGGMALTSCNGTDAAVITNSGTGTFGVGNADVTYTNTALTAGGDIRAKLANSRLTVDAAASEVHIYQDFSQDALDAQQKSMTFDGATDIGALANATSLTVGSNAAVSLAQSALSVSRLTMQGGSLTLDNQAGALSTSSLQVNATSTLNANLTLGSGAVVTLAHGAQLDTGGSVTLQGGASFVLSAQDRVTTTNYVTVLNGVADVLGADGQSVTLNGSGWSKSEGADKWSIDVSESYDAATQTYTYTMGGSSGRVLVYDRTNPAGGALMLTPEPATATLSLLALAGLASRRRRK